MVITSLSRPQAILPVAIPEGKLPEPEELLEYILQEAACEKDLAGKKVLITAGATQRQLTRYVM